MSFGIVHVNVSVFHVPVSDDQPPTLPTLILCALVGRCLRPGLPVYLGLCDIQVVPNQLKYLAAASVSCSCKTVCTRSTSPSGFSRNGATSCCSCDNGVSCMPKTHQPAACGFLSVRLA